MAEKRNKFVFCVDSDGCAMDTMTYKHQLFLDRLRLTPLVLKKKDFLKEWNRVNLYSRTRGVNRFVGLVMGLDYAGVTEIENLKKWVETTASLSNQALEEAIVAKDSEDLKKALQWSKEVNHQIRAYQGEVLAFLGAREALAKLQALGDVYVVSSANKEAVVEEWQNQALMPYVKDLYCQERGKKEDVIAELIAKGYDKEKIMMVGDSPGDLVATELNQVQFYPILVGKEENSWLDLKDGLADEFVAGHFSDLDAKSLKDAFWQNLDK
ncbi:HAD hydrolase-like protein [Streptococcus iniae]|nr:HAD hydrolase-like protein [Streptococcus iniae]WNZ97691.1 HAD hydrolase-like protein [Streptococcus iniae]